MTSVSMDRPFFGPLFIASRPKTLLASVIPVTIGSLLVHSETGSLNLILFIFTLLSALSIQIATNFFNDAIDDQKGADTLERLGPQRMASSGQLTSQSLIIAGITFAVIAITYSLPLVAIRGWPIIAIGIPSLFLSYVYTGGPWPIAYRGLGELFVFIFFGVIAVSGSAYVQCGTILPESILLGIQVGLLASVLIAINNARDIQEDRGSGKMTLAARFGIRFARAEVFFLSITPYLIGLSWIVFDEPLLATIPLIGIVLSGWVAFRVATIPPSSFYNKYLGASVLAYLCFSVLMILALYLS